MIRLYILNVPEFRPVIEEASRSAQSAEPVGDYVEITHRNGLTVDRRAAGARRSVWFSTVGALVGGTVTQFDSDTLRIQPR